MTAQRALMASEQADGPVPPEVRLFRYVVLNAVLDAIYGSSWSNDSDKVRSDALRWFAEAGSDFRMITECAGWNPERVRRKAIDYIVEQRKAPHKAPRPPINAHGEVRKAA